MKTKNLLLTMVIASLAMTGFSELNAKTIYYVKANGTGNGSSWSAAAGNIQSMIDKAVAGDEVWVAAGMYYPTKQTDASDELSKTFLMKNGVNLYGGFAGNETSIDKRAKSDKDGDGKVDAWEFTNETVLSGKLDGTTDVWTKYIFNTNLWRWNITGSKKNSYTVVTCPATITNTTYFDGFTVRDGSSKTGGVNTEGQTIVQNCIVSYNNSGSNEAIWNHNGIVTNCYIYHNNGTGILNSYGTVSDCTIDSNNSYTTSTSTVGGGLSNAFGKVTNCKVTNNAAIAFYAGTTSVTNVQTWGGGIYNYTGTIDKCLVMNNLCYSYNPVTHAGSSYYAMAYGGGIYDNGGIVSNCCVFNNKVAAYAAYGVSYEGPLGGGVYAQVNTNMIYNTTIVNNSNGYNSSSSNYYGSGTSYNCITDSTGKYQNFIYPTSFAGNATTDAQYAELLKADWHLKAGSQYIDAGSLANLPDWVISGTDLAGKPRTHNDKISLGAYEYDSSYTGINELQPSNVAVFPNPATDYITIVGATASRITVSDLSGRVVYQQAMTSDKETIAVSSWAKGIYLVVVQTGNNKTVSKIVKK